MFKFHFAELSNNPPEGIAAGMPFVGRISMDNNVIVMFLYLLFSGPKHEENFFEWECYITYVA